MNVEDGSNEPVTDLRLSLNYSSQCIQLNSNSGAGANAASRAEMTFVASDPLSELVWSPHKGLSLKCADCSLTEQRPSLFWGLGPSSMVHSPSQSINVRQSNSDKSVDKIISLETFDAKRDVDANSSFTKYSTRNCGTMTPCGSTHEPNIEANGNIKGGNTAVEALAVDDVNKKQDHKDCKRKGMDFYKSIQTAINLESSEKKLSSYPGLKQRKMANTLLSQTDDPRPDVMNVEQKSGDYYKATSFGPTSGCEYGNNFKQPIPLEVGMTSGLDYMKQCEVPDGSTPNPTFSIGEHNELALVLGNKAKSIMKTPGSSSPPLEKQESSAENDVQAVVSKIADSGSEDGIKNLCQAGEDVGLGDNNIQVEHSPTNSQIRLHRRKGKGKVLSDTDMSAKMSEHEDDSHESVESCNSAGLFCRGKKRWNLEQQFIIGSKRFRNQIQEGPESTSYAGQNSSFMTWISNMIKGFSKSNQDEAPSLTLAHSSPGHETRDLKLVKHGEPKVGCKNTSFQNIFCSLYCPISRGQESAMNAKCLNDEETNEHELGGQVVDINVTPIASNLVNNNSFQQYPQSNEKYDQSNVAAQEEKSGNVENNISGNLESRVEICLVSPSHSSLDKHKTVNAENNNSDPPSKGNATYTNCPRTDPLGSLWVTRFCPKSPAPLACHFNQSTSEVDCAGLVHKPLNCIGTSKDQKTMGAWEISPEGQSSREKNANTCTGASVGFKRYRGHNDLNSENKLNPVSCSQKFRSSEAMASTFARRLDALKHIIPSAATVNAHRATMTCFYCGTRGHNLRDCTEVSEKELTDLLRNWNSYNGAEESPCLCVKCFQLNHWAIECPNVSSKRSKYGDTLSNCRTGGMHLNNGYQREQTSWNKNIPLEVSVSRAICDQKNPGIDSNLRLHQKLNKMLISEENSELANNDTASNCEKAETKETHAMLLGSCINMDIADVPRGFFDAIKRLRLSRTDILKWMDSQISLSHLDGFFVRLRVGKWEEGLGGTGYHVGCIDGSGTQVVISPPSAKTCISVNIGGIKCLVKSHYVSNHDFLEEELTAWWTATLRNGDKIPSEEDLSLKHDERTKLGF